MKLIIGLGNPGSEYQMTRHNFGALLLEHIVTGEKTAFRDFKKIALTARYSIGGESGILVKPLSFMNESGASVTSLKNFYKIAPEDVILVYDDIDLPFGTLRIGVNATSGGHRGVESVIESMGSSDFVRLRLGIGPKTIAADAYVLQQWSVEQKKGLPTILDRAREALQMIMGAGVEKAANKFN